MANTLLLCFSNVGPYNNDLNEILIAWNFFRTARTTSNRGMERVGRQTQTFALLLVPFRARQIQLPAWSPTILSLTMTFPNFHYAKAELAATPAT